MVKCLHCQSEIQELLSVERSFNTYTFDGEDYSLTPIETEADWDFPPVFLCPVCKKELCDGEEAASDFLHKGVEQNA